MPAQADFLGTGWAFPPRFDLGGAEVAMVSGHEDIAQSLGILLATRQGERVMQEDFGCELGEFLFGEFSQRLVGRVRDLVSDAILHHEPRIRLDEVRVSAERAGDGVLLLDIDYTVRATNSRFNLVYPFYLREATAGAAGATGGGGG